MVQKSHKITCHKKKQMHLVAWGLHRCSNIISCCNLKRLMSWPVCILASHPWFLCCNKTNSASHVASLACMYMWPSMHQSRGHVRKSKQMLCIHTVSMFLILDWHHHWNQGVLPLYISAHWTIQRFYILLISHIYSVVLTTHNVRKLYKRPTQKLFLMNSVK